MMQYANRTLVATVVEPDARPRVDAAADGRFRSVHMRTLPEAIRAVRERPVHAVLLSPKCVPINDLPRVRALVDGFPGVATVAVLSRFDMHASERLLELGACGVRRLLDLSRREGWEGLRQIVADPVTPATAHALARVLPALDGAAPATRQFFELLLRLAPTTPSVRRLTVRLGVRSSTFVSRFFRARLPSPKRYLAAARLAYAAGLFEAPGRSVADVAYQLEYSSPQSFGRHVRTALGVTAVEFRRRYPFDIMIDDFVSRLIAPYRAAFRTFQPLTNGVRDLGQRKALAL
jgi:AraC-like DNA-binding protein